MTEPSFSMLGADDLGPAGIQIGDGRRALGRPLSARPARPVSQGFVLAWHVVSRLMAAAEHVALPAARRRAAQSLPLAFTAGALIGALASS